MAGEILSASDRAPGVRGHSWFKAMRSPDAMELIKANPNAYVLAAVIASRAKFTEGFSANGTTFGEALLGDHDTYGMTRGQYRTAIRQLCKWSFATIKTTSQGTIARLLDRRLFEVMPILNNHRNNHPTASAQPSSGHRTTTNIDQVEILHGKEGGDKVPRSAVAKNGPKLVNALGWQLAKDRKRLKEQISEAKEAINLDPSLIAGLNSNLHEINEEIRRRGKANTMTTNRPARPQTPVHGHEPGKTDAPNGKPAPQIARQFAELRETLIKRPPLVVPGVICLSLHAWTRIVMGH